MNLLGIDYGRLYLGLAISEADVPYPLTVIKSKSDDHKIREIEKICQDKNITKIVMGSCSGKLVNHLRGFVRKLKKRVSQPIIMVDETLTSKKALELMILSNVPQKKRREKEHAYAAVILLKDYLNQV